MKVELVYEIIEENDVLPNSKVEIRILSYYTSDVLFIQDIPSNSFSTHYIMPQIFKDDVDRQCQTIFLLLLTI